MPPSQSGSSSTGPAELVWVPRPASQRGAPNKPDRCAGKAEAEEEGKGTRTGQSAPYHVRVSFQDERIFQARRAARP